MFLWCMILGVKSLCASGSTTRNFLTTYQWNQHETSQFALGKLGQDPQPNLK